MINVNELRKGNYVNTGNGITVVNSIGGEEKDGINLEVSKHGYTIVPEYLCEDISGIPLTPEILVKCGFISDYFPNYFKKYINDFYLNIDVNKGGGYMEREVNDSGVEFNIRQELKYLHQLQNLNYWLTGEELKL